MQLRKYINMLYMKTLNILSCIFLQFRIGATTQQNPCREKSYILVAVTEITETCIGLSEIKEIIGTNTQSDAFQETLQQSIMF